MSESLTLYKLIILYMLKKVNFPLKNAQITDFILGQEYTSYFHLQQAISEMTESGLLDMETSQNTSSYQMTDNGKQTIDFFEDQIPDAIKDDIMRYLDANAYEMRNEMMTRADYDKIPMQNDYSVHCYVKEGNGTLMELQLTVPEESIARQMVSVWPEKSQQIYEYLMKELMSGSDKKD